MKNLDGGTCQAQFGFSTTVHLGVLFSAKMTAKFATCAMTGCLFESSAVSLSRSELVGWHYLPAYDGCSVMFCNVLFC
jgi:hypothetical protein